MLAALAPDIGAAARAAAREVFTILDETLPAIDRIAVDRAVLLPESTEASATQITAVRRHGACDPG
ncbi:hypothetical protein OG883_05585 [Streptomyces sp. NBC_01142]|uniref:hypothetical protein n=1 Tax=Streptomyces sp. NBC_01142 TaxID=2975865 RepID=UPI0022561F36|nr:hypothetical protein [Streptomyces sp. NBC_01142]MCX4819385.1 hypothetical protein [Streptomyces sp. NBC_01142]